jgi:hypothetical protein
LALKSNASPKKLLLQWLGTSSRIALTPEDKLIADSFKANREVFLGLSRGFISLGYGDQAHPI